MEQPGFWDDVAKSTSVSRQLKKLQDSLEEYQKLEQDFSDIETLIQMAEEEGDSSMIEEIGEMLTAFQKEFENYRISLLLSGEFDGYDAVMTLHAGAGGTESCDWTSMLYRMYTRWAEKHGFKVEVLDYLEGDEAGINPDQRAECIRIFEIRKRRTSSGSYFTVQCSRQATDFVCFLRCDTGDRGRSGSGYQ